MQPIQLKIPVAARLSLSCVSMSCLALFCLTVLGACGQEAYLETDEATQSPSSDADNPASADDVNTASSIPSQPDTNQTPDSTSIEDTAATPPPGNEGNASSGITEASETEANDEPNAVPERDSNDPLVGANPDNTQPDNAQDVPVLAQTETPPPVDELLLQGVDVLIPRVEQSLAPAIDGQRIDYQPGGQLLAGEWRSSVQTNLTGGRLRIDNLMMDTNGNGDRFVNHHWAAVHDGTYVYFLVVSDDAGINISDTNEPLKIWKDDDLEVYFDGNNSKLTSYDGVDDFHFHINLLDPVTRGSNNSYNDTQRSLQAINSATLPSDMSFATGPRQGPESPRTNAGRQDIYELRIKLSELNIAIGQPFGIEFQINDDDDGDTRDSKWGWYHPIGTPGADDLTWRDPSYMGTAMLQP